MSITISGAKHAHSTQAPEGLLPGLLGSSSASIPQITLSGFSTRIVPSSTVASSISAASSSSASVTASGSSAPIMSAVTHHAAAISGGVIAGVAGLAGVLLLIHVLRRFMCTAREPEFDADNNPFGEHGEAWPDHKQSVSSLPPVQFSPSDYRPPLHRNQSSVQFALPQAYPPRPAFPPAYVIGYPPLEEEEKRSNEKRDTGSSYDAATTVAFGAHSPPAPTFPDSLHDSDEPEQLDDDKLHPTPALQSLPYVPRSTSPLWDLER